MLAKGSKRVGMFRAVLLRLVVNFDGNIILLAAISAVVGHVGVSRARVIQY